MHELCELFHLEGFLGVIPSPDLLSKRHSRLKEDTFCMIVNTRGHFVVLIKKPGLFIYIDPAGLPCLDPNIRQFIKKHTRKDTKFLYNQRAIQDPESIHCSLYCLLFLIKLCSKEEEEEGQEEKKAVVHFKKRDLQKNDGIVVKALKELVSELEIKTTRL